MLPWDPLVLFMVVSEGTMVLSLHPEGMFITITVVIMKSQVLFHYFTLYTYLFSTCLN